MGYYDNRNSVQEYIAMAEGYDGSMLLDVLKKHLPTGSTVLELGMGPGKDLELLGTDCVATGSDHSELFLDLYRENHPDADLLFLDAVSLDTDRQFDCIYSNKVLIHLSELELRASFARQAAVLNPRGLLMHSFWYGDQEAEEQHGLTFYYYTEPVLTQLAGEAYTILDVARYKEIVEGDSVYLLMQKIEASTVQY